jgi:hypothetical protein
MANKNKYCLLYLILALVLVIAFCIYLSNKKEKYASQIAHAYAGNIAGPMPDYVRYPGRYELPNTV